MSTFAPADPGFEQRVRESFSRLALMTTIRARLVKVAPGEVDIEMPFHDNLTQQHGYVAAAVVTAIVDTACGYAAMSLMPVGVGVVTVEYKVQLHLPRARRAPACARARREARTRTDCLCR
jgi:acyl-coenzyme A thioesterase PaaI-like protein